VAQIPCQLVTPPKFQGTSGHRGFRETGGQRRSISVALKSGNFPWVEKSKGDQGRFRNRPADIDRSIRCAARASPFQEIVVPEALENANTILQTGFRARDRIVRKVFRPFGKLRATLTYALRMSAGKFSGPRLGAGRH